MELVLIRGLPGSGKTTLAKQMFPEHDHYEADMFFVGLDGKYRFDPYRIRTAHWWCREQTEKALRAGRDVVVTNTFTKKWEMAEYLEIAKATGADVKVIKCTGKFCNVHNVPAASIEKMLRRWEDVEGEIEYDPTVGWRAP